MQHPLSKNWAGIRDDYKITRRLGQGAHGEVVKAKHRETGEVVAIKMIPVKVPEQQKYIDREIEIMKYLSSEQSEKVVNLLDVLEFTCPDDGLKLVFLVMDYMPQTLQDVLHGPILNELEVRNVIYNILCALDFLHGAGVMHRDIKPSNILVGDNHSIKICDFGMAKVCEPHSQGPLTRRNSLHVVTRFYRPPEVILMEDLQGPYIDIWSAGCVFMEIIAKQAPYCPPGSEAPAAVFKGSSCYPLSPSVNSRKKVEVSDQLRVILSSFGRLEEEDTHFIDKNRDYFNCVYKKSNCSEKAPLDLKEELSDSPPSLVALISDMLQFNPLNRKPAASLILSSYFQNEGPKP